MRPLRLPVSSRILPSFLSSRRIKMDSEDERIDVRRRTRQRGYGDPPAFEDAPKIDLRLYQLEERGVEIMLKYGTKPANVDESSEAMRRKNLRFRGFPYSFLRFCDTLKGFHTGYLDLTGRHEYRYLSVIKTWGEFRRTVMTVLRAAQPMRAQDELNVLNVSWRTLGEDAKPACIVVDAAALRKLRRWQLPVGDLDLLVSLVDDVQHCMEADPLPKYQRLRLLDLPNELLHRIARRAEPRSLRNFGSTCKLLRDISWQTLREERTIGLTATTSTRAVYRLINLSGKERDKEEHKLALDERKKFFEDADAICARPEVAQSIRRLSLTNCELLVRRVGVWGPTENHSDFDRRFDWRILDIIVKTTSLTQLSLHNIKLTAKLLEAMFTLPLLSHLEISTCPVDFRDGEPRNRPAKLEHLTLKCFDTALWKVVHFLPDLRWLYVHGIDEHRSLPPLSVTQRTNPFATIERLRINRVDRLYHGDELQTLLLLLQAAAELRLTHVKLTFPHGITGDETAALIAALARAPVRVLVLEGLSHAPPRLLALIANALPALEGLTLVYHDRSMEAIGPIVAHWPAPASEYAAALARCSRLEHFGWNYLLRAHVSPAATIHHFEEGFCARECAHDAPADGPLDGLEDILRLFAESVPSLTSLAIHERSGLPGTVCGIKRDTRGMPVFDIYRQMFCNDSKWAGLCERYSPEYFVSWPLFGETSSGFD